MPDTRTTSEMAQKTCLSFSASPASLRESFLPLQRRRVAEGINQPY
jgi:hypothetical protein